MGQNESRNYSPEETSRGYKFDDNGRNSSLELTPTKMTKLNLVKGEPFSPSSQTRFFNKFDVQGLAIEAMKSPMN